MKTLGLDIGGANIKAAHGDGGAWTLAFALWQEPDLLGALLCDWLLRLPKFDRLALTMTAELCDCFATKRQGVEYVLRVVEHAAGPRPIGVWTTRGVLVTPEQARHQPLQCAAANWHALATYLARRYPHDRSLMIDVGSTTTDLIRLESGRVAAWGLTDMDRLASGELLYLGAARTPLLAMGPSIEWNGRTFGLMAERFATTADVMVLLGRNPEQPDYQDTADGRPLTRACSAARVARMIGADMEMLSMAQAEDLAERFFQVCCDRLADAMHRVWAAAEPLPCAPQRLLISGSGSSLAQAAARRVWPDVPRILLSDQLDEPSSHAACAYALAQLWSQS